MSKFITITVVQKVKVPVTDDFTLRDFCEVLTENKLFDDDRIDWDKEEVVEEDYSFAPHECEFENGNRVYKFNSPYAIGTLYTEVNAKCFDL